KFTLAGAQGAQMLTLTGQPVSLAAGADWTVHITAQTSATECGLYNNSATLTTGNANNPDPATAHESCNPANIMIEKKADKALVNAGEDIGFTITVWNEGAGEARGTTLSDSLPQNSGLSWSIDAVGAGWGDSCEINPAGTMLSCGPVTVPGNTDKETSSFTVHITSSTDKTTAGDCPETGVVNNTGEVTTSNDGSGESGDHVCVQQSSPAIVTVQDPASGAIGDTYKDSATLSGTVNQTGNGSITFKLYPAADCGGTVLDTETVSVDDNGTFETPTGVVLTNAGTYYWVASFSGDKNNDSATSGCNDEQVVVAPNSPAISTLLSETNGQVGDSVHDSATLTGVTAGAGGNVTYSVYSNATCSAKFADAGTVSVTNGAVPDSNPVTFPTAGTYYWQASYSGDANNKAAISACSSEVLVINELPPPVFCVAISKLTPQQLVVGRKTKVTIHLTQHNVAKAGVHVRITGKKINMRTKASNSQGVIKTTLKLKRAGILKFSPIFAPSCGTKRIGVRAPFTPPVTG
ncbi:MAG: hypothetical protein ACRDL7_00185, partial [Gaiellaceae bacterium]